MMTEGLALGGGGGEVILNGRIIGEVAIVEFMSVVKPSDLR